MILTSPIAQWSSIEAPAVAPSFVYYRLAVTHQRPQWSCAILLALWLPLLNCAANSKAPDCWGRRLVPEVTCQPVVSKERSDRQIFYAGSPGNWRGEYHLFCYITVAGVLFIYFFKGWITPSSISIWTINMVTRNHGKNI